MSKEQFVGKLASRLALNEKEVESIMDATIAEIFTPAIFAPPGERTGFFDNDCNNNCKEEVARISTMRGAK
ncbi:MAG: hypothetical protein KZQ76_15030 [Candidatus Thiodiazotropha sp. (ex Epidulcina cf. delphinae)]|nr:hypothetical protein [Candidatus Thiodiazotropha sp. (ex Epidulcina cf. delphinae)]